MTLTKRFPDTINTQQNTVLCKCNVFRLIREREKETLRNSRSDPYAYSEWNTREILKQPIQCGQITLSDYRPNQFHFMTGLSRNNSYSGYRCLFLPRHCSVSLDKRIEKNFAAGKTESILKMFFFFFHSY